MMRFLRACAVAGALLTVTPPVAAAALSAGAGGAAGLVALSSDLSTGALAKVEALAKEEQPQPPKGFVPVDEVPAGEQIPAINMVAAAYGFVWLAVLGYVWSIAKRLKQVESELSDLESRRK